MDSCLQSPYCNAYKVPNKQKGEHKLLKTFYIT